MDRVIFVCGSAGKVEEVKRLLGTDNIDHVNIDLDELQCDPHSPEVIAIEKCKEASKIVSGPVFVEDVTLFYGTQWVAWAVHQVVFKVFGIRRTDQFTPSI